MSSITSKEEPSLPLNRFIPLNFAKIKVYFKDSDQKITKSLALPVFEGMSYKQMGKAMMSGLKVTLNTQKLWDLKQNREILIKENELPVPQENKLYLISEVNWIEEGGRQTEERNEVARKKKEEEEEDEERKGSDDNVRKEEEGKKKEEEGRRKEDEIKKKEDEGRKKREDGKKKEEEVVRKEEEGKRKDEVGKRREEEGRESLEDEYTSMRNEHSAKTASTGIILIIKKFSFQIFQMNLFS